MLSSHESNAMKAMVLKAPGELVLDEVSRPGASAGYVLVRVTYTGICGTDLKIFSGAIPVKYPRIMGHEMIGEVVEGIGALRPGDRVIGDPELFCCSSFHFRTWPAPYCSNEKVLF